MSTTRRTILSGALAAPFLAQFAGTASGATLDATWGTMSDGHLDVWLTQPSQRQLDLWQTTMEPIAPATLLTDGGRTGVRFPVRSGTGALTPSNLPQSQGTGLLDGGLTLQGLLNKFEITQPRIAVGDERVSLKCMVNGLDSGGESVLRCETDAARLVADPVPAGQPLKVRIEEIPAYLTPESLEAFKTAFGAPQFDVDTVVAHATADFVYVPPRA